MVKSILGIARGQILSPKDHSVKRTTIFLDEEERDYIDSLIEKGRELGIKPLISKMFDVYRNLRIYDWKYLRGEYYMGIIRVAFLNVEFIYMLTQYISKKMARNWTKGLGNCKVSMEASINIETDNLEKCRKSLSGYGYRVSAIFTWKTSS